MSFLTGLLSTISGNQGFKVSEQLLFDKVIGFKGVVPGLGTSTILQSVVVALSEKTSYNICVFDANFLYPMQYSFLVDYDDGTRKDILEFTGDLAEIALPTRYQDVYLVSIKDRKITDMMSSKDSEHIIQSVIGSLKTYFDIILIDLSYELTNINVHAAIRCNKIYNIVDPSLKSMYHLKKSLNTMATLAVNFSKANKVIINKHLPDMVLGVEKTLEDTGLELLGTIPLSKEVAKLGVAGKVVWGTPSKDASIIKFNEVIDRIVDDILQKTPLNEKNIVTSEQLRKIAEKKLQEGLENNEELDIVQETVISATEVSLDEVESQSYSFDYSESSESYEESIEDNNNSVNDDND